MARTGDMRISLGVRGARAAGVRLLKARAIGYRGAEPSERGVLLDGELHVDGGLRHRHVVLVGELDGDDGQALALLDARVDDLAVQERGVTGEGRVAVLRVG